MYALGEEKAIVLSPKVKAVFERYRKGLPCKESGGILLGRICLNQAIIIEEITEPSSKDKAGFFFFERNVPTAQEIINEKWKKSDGKLIYLGEWHTHNESIPHPSGEDKKMIKSLLKESKMQIDFLLMIIVGFDSHVVWLQTQKKFRQVTISKNPFVYDLSFL